MCIRNCFRASCRFTFLVMPNPYTCDFCVADVPCPCQIQINHHKKGFLGMKYAVFHHFCIVNVHNKSLMLVLFMQKSYLVNGWGERSLLLLQIEGLTSSLILLLMSASLLIDYEAPIPSRCSSSSMFNPPPGALRRPCFSPSRCSSWCSVCFRVLDFLTHKLDVLPSFWSWRYFIFMGLFSFLLLWAFFSNRPGPFFCLHVFLVFGLLFCLAFSHSLSFAFLFSISLPIF